MRETLKNILKIFKLNRSARIFRKIFYLIFDFTGHILFLNFLKNEKKIKERDIKKILLIRTDRIGDLVLTTPAMRAVREKYPAAEIHLLIKEYTKDLVVENQDIDKLIIMGKDKLENDYNIAFAFHPGIKQNHITFKSGAKYRVGYDGQGGSFFLTHKVKDDRERRVRHEVESALEIVRAAGCVTDKKKLNVSVTGEGERFAEEFFNKYSLANHKVVIIHPGSRHQHIRWFPERYAEVADRLIEEKGVDVIALEGPGEENILKEMLNYMKNKAVVARKLELTQLISIIKKSSMFIGNSTGTMHIAAALDIPVVAIFGNKHPLDSYQEWGPWSDKSVIIHKDPGCSKCHPSDCSDFQCMKMVTVADVINAVKKAESRND